MGPVAPQRRPFGVNTRGDYTGTAEALNAVISYVRSIPESEIVLMPADIVCNLDLAAAIAQHDASGCGITAICRGGAVTGEHHRYLTDAHGRVTKLITSAAAGTGVASMEIYIVNKDVLLDILDFCAQENRFHFHRDGLFQYLGRGGTMDVFLHTGYAVRVDAVADYFAASMDMLDPAARASLFPADRPVRTKERADVSTNLTSVTFSPGISPISRKCCRRAPSPPTVPTTAVSPMFKSFNVIWNVPLERVC